ncbi:MAG: hypothetical protein DIU80_017760 [Chloroflexota bacterium]|nr:MAG: hypothetical protein DIU80_20585 [Chloroflexota bacterium]
MGLPASWKLAALAALAALALVMGAVVSAAGIQRRVFDPPSFEFTLGPVRLSGFVTSTPNCRVSSYSQRKNSLCSGQSIYSPDEYFAVWLLVRSKRGAVTFEQADRLFLLRLEQRP